MSNVIYATFDVHKQTAIDEIDLDFLDQLCAEIYADRMKELTFEDESLWDLFEYDSPADIKQARAEYKQVLKGAGCDELEIARELNRLFPKK